MILVDTREQLPLWDPLGPWGLSVKLDVGDYTTKELINIAHAERKSGIDLYGSIIQGHERFRKEILRAKEKNITLAVFVECTKEQFVAKRFEGGFRLKSPPASLKKIITTISDKYDLNFYWCNDRSHMRTKIAAWLAYQRSLNLERINAKTTKNTKK